MSKRKNPEAPSESGALDNVPVPCSNVIAEVKEEKFHRKIFAEGDSPEETEERSPTPQHYEQFKAMFTKVQDATLDSVGGSPSAFKDFKSIIALAYENLIALVGECDSIRIARMTAHHGAIFKAAYKELYKADAHRDYVEGRIPSELLQYHHRDTGKRYIVGEGIQIMYCHKEEVWVVLEFKHSNEATPLVQLPPDIICSSYKTTQFGKCIVDFQTGVHMLMFSLDNALRRTSCRGASDDAWDKNNARFEGSDDEDDEDEDEEE
jgi:hypothetical protein